MKNNNEGTFRIRVVVFSLLVGIVLGVDLTAEVIGTLKPDAYWKEAIFLGLLFVRGFLM